MNVAGCDRAVYRYRNVLLIKFHTRVGYGARRPPVGLGYIAKALSDAGIDYRVVDCDLGKSLDDILDMIRSFSPDLIGISMVTLGYIESYRTIERIKEASDGDIILGGPHVSTLREEVLEECGGIDYGVVGEGERVVVDLCRGVPLDEIPGLIFRRGDEIVYHPVSHPIMEIDALGFPTYEGFELDAYFGHGNEIGIVTSRGCPYGCTFCAVRLIMGSRIRLRSARSVAEEFQFWYDEGYRRFVILDDNFSQDRQRVFEICDALDERGIENIQISLANGLRADKTDFDMLERLRDAGVYEIQIGVEAASDRLLKIIKKGESLATIERAIQDCIRLGYEVGVNFLVGSLGETREEVLMSFRFVEQFDLARAYFFNIIPYPGTRLFQEIEAQGGLLKPPEAYLGTMKQRDDEPVFVTPELPYEDRVRLLKQSLKVSDRVRRRFLAKKLSKYGPLARPLAFLASWHVTEPLLKRNKLINTVLLPMYYSLIKKSSVPGDAYPPTSAGAGDVTERDERRRDSVD